MIRANVFVATMVLVALAGCVHAPKVVYSTVPSTEEKWAGANYKFEAGPIRFRMAASVIAVTASSPAASGVVQGNAGTVLSSLGQISNSYADVDQLKAAKPIATVIKVPGTTLYAAYADDPFYFRSNLSPQYVPGTFLMSSLGAAAEDNSVAMIQSAGTLIATLLPIVALVEFDPKQQPLSLPAVFDLSAGSAAHACWNDADNQDTDRRKWCTMPGDGSWQFAIDTREAPLGTMSEQAFFENARNDESKYGHLFPVSACVPVELLLRSGPNGKQYKFDVVVADPSRVYAMVIPAKGTISMPDVCGANLTVNASGSPTDLDIASALIQQVAAVKNAGAAAPAASAASGI